MWARDEGQLSVRLLFARNYSTSIPASFGLQPWKTAPELLQSVPIPLNFRPGRFAFPAVHLRSTKTGCFEKRQPRGIFAPVSSLECGAGSGLFGLSWTPLGMPFRQLSPHHFAPRLLPSSMAPQRRQYPVAGTAFPSRHSRLHHTPESPPRVKRIGPMPLPHASQISVM
jgi:hypothetical protein